RAQRAKQKHPYRVATVRKSRDHVECREVCPMEVLEHEHEQPVGGDSLKHLADLAHHPLARGPEGVTLESATFIGFHERWKLEQPRWCAPAQRLDHPWIVRSTHQLIDGLDHWVVRLLAAESLDRLAACDPNARHLSHTLDKQVHKRRLPDAGLSSEQD